jgi:hypothetical protein
VVYENNQLDWTWSDTIPAVFDNQWHHVVATYDADAGEGGTGLVKVFLDGNPPSHVTNMDPNIPNIHLDTVRIGDTFNPDIKGEGILAFDGQIDNVRIYDYPLSLANSLWLKGETELTYFSLDSAANFVPKVPDDQVVNPNNLDIINFKDYAIMADNWLGLEEPTLWP